ncbi:hypothetical protein BJX65DRAFT_281376 [Aspergillus insuetus]
MSFAPPPGPPPPSVPEGWTTQFDDNYRQWFYINLATGKSQWEPPQATPALTPPAVAPVPPSEQQQQHQAEQLGGLPPSYEDSGPGNPSAVASAEESEKKKANLFNSNNPYNEFPGPSGSGPGPESGIGEKGAASKTVESDAELAARLQAEENARSGASSAGPGAASNYYDDNTPPATAGAGERGKEKKKGFFSKLMSKASSGSASPGHGFSGRPAYAAPQHHHQQPVGYGGYPPQGPYGAPSPGPGYGAPGGYYPPQQGYGPGYGPQPGYGYPQQTYYAQPQRRRPGGGGMGMAGAAALGVGGGLIGGALLADAIDDDHDDYGGGDDFGGDF